MAHKRRGRFRGDGKQKESIKKLYPGGWAQVITQERVTKTGVALGRVTRRTPAEVFQEEMQRIKAREAWARRPDTKF